jgi:hypothetical protein
MSQFYKYITLFFGGRTQNSKGYFLMWNYFEQNMSIISSTEKIGRKRNAGYLLLSL